MTASATTFRRRRSRRRHRSHDRHPTFKEVFPTSPEGPSRFAKATGWSLVGAFLLASMVFLAFAAQKDILLSVILKRPLWW